MSSKYQCPHCNGLFQVDASFAGGQVACPSCQGVVALPEAPVAPQPPPPSSPPGRDSVGGGALACPYCGGHFQIAPEMAGQTVACPHCQQAVAAPGAQQAPFPETPLQGEQPLRPPGGDGGPGARETPLPSPQKTAHESKLPEFRSPASDERQLPSPAVPGGVQSQQAETPRSPSVPQDPNLLPPGLASTPSPARTEQAASASALPENAGNEVESMLPPTATPQDELLPPGASEIPGEEVAVVSGSVPGIPTIQDEAKGSERLADRFRTESNEVESRLFHRNLVLWVGGLILLLIVIGILAYVGPIETR